MAADIIATEVLPRRAPGEVGADPEVILGFLDAVEAAGIELHSLMLARAGAVVAEGWWAPYRAALPHMQHSLTKSFAATAIGLAVGEGIVALDDRVLGFFPEEAPREPSANLAAMTVRDLLTMRCGHAEGISGAAWRQIETSWIAEFLKVPVPHAPGTHFVYSSAASYMLSAILQRASGETMADFLTPRLFRPLGITSLTWDVGPGGINPGGNGVACRTEDILKLGLLHLQGGVWQGAPVVPADWVRAATAPIVLPAGSEMPGWTRGYGYHWWTGPDGAFFAAGMFGQYSIVLPAQDAVLALTAAVPEGDRRLLGLVWRTLGVGLGTGRRDPAAEARLARRLDGLRLPASPPDPGSPRAALVSGRWFDMAANEDGVAAIRLDLEGDAPRFRLRDGRGEHAITLGLSAPVEGWTTMTGNRLHHEYQPARLRVVASGGWTGPDVFAMTWQFNETAFRDTVTCRFAGDGVVMERAVNVNSAALRRPDVTGRLRPS